MSDSTGEVTVLHVDSDDECRAQTRESLEREDDRLTVVSASDTEAGLERVREADIDCVVSDYQLPDRDGLAFFEAVREEHPDLPFVLCTGEGSESVAAEAVSAGVTDYLQKRSGTEQYARLATRVVDAVERVERAEGDWHRTVIETMEEGIYVIDGDYDIRFANYRIGPDPPTEEEWSGRSLSYLVSAGVLSETEVASIEAGVDSLLDGETDEVRIELDPSVPDAGAVELRLTPMRPDGGDPLVLGTTHDVTDRIEREAKLRRATERYRTLIDNFPNGGVFTFDEDLRHTLAGGEELEAVGLTAADVEGATPSDLYPEEIASELEENYRAALHGAANTFKQSYMGRHYRVHTLPIRGDDGADITSGMAVSQNVTERIEYERELERQNERLDEFTSVVSHDLRNPLTVLAGAVEMAERTGEDEHFERARRAIDRMEQLVEDLRTLAKQGDRVTDLEPIGLSRVTEECWRTVETPDARAEVDAEGTVLADENRLKQLFENCFRNAVEHSDDPVTITVGETDDGFFVADDGPGIPPDERDQVFESGYSTSTDGTGFGLSIVESIVEAHDWEIDLAESPDGGARFEVTDVETPS